MLVQEPTQAAIWHCLNHYAYADASFLSERLYAEVGTDDALHLLATCYYRAGKVYSAYSLLQKHGAKTAQCKFLMSKCCLDLSKLAEAEMILLESHSLSSKGIDKVAQEFSDSGSFALQLVGQICKKSERRSKAADAYLKSLKLNPFLFSSYQSLCDLGNEPDPSKIFQVSNLENFNMCQGSNSLISLVNNQSQYSNANSINNLVINENCNQQLDNNIQSPGLVTTPLTSYGMNVMVNSSPLPILIKSTPKLDSSDTLKNTSFDLSTPDGSFNSQNTMPGNMNKNNENPKINGRIGRNLLGNAPSNSPFTPSFGFLPLETPSPVGEYVNTSLAFITPSPPLICDGLKLRDGKPPAKRVISRANQNKLSLKPPVFSQSFNTPGLNASNVSLPPVSSPTPNAQQSVTCVRRSTRLFSNSNSVKENNKSSSKSNRFASPKAPPRKTKTRSGKSSAISQENFGDINELNKNNESIASENKINAQMVNSASINHAALNMQKVSADGLMNLLQVLGQAYLHLAKYDCQKVIDTLSRLPPQHHYTGWVQSSIGRANFELAQYNQVTMRKSEPHRMEGLEYYSTALWHLQKEIALSTLAQELTDLDKLSAQAWCAAGNCFSLQKEHDTAIKFFERAVQVSPNFPYAYTLLGHEYVVTEELDKAMSCYRNAIRIDLRHYNAWYGVGMIYYKMEKFHLAELHFERSLSINPQSSVLMCHVAVVQHALQKTEAALITLNKAIASNPKNPLCKFHRASIYFASDRHHDALAELEELKEIVPKESLVYFLIGKVHKRLGNTHLALMNFSWATDLDPKGANNQMKEAIDKRYANDDDDLALPANEVVDIQSPSGPADNDDELSANSSTIMEAEEEMQQNMESDESY
ncbi:Cell division cycle protein 27 [Nymphon striatum]|nr:Cell division cycle protein 27 [Nymphon striatum]